MSYVLCEEFWTLTLPVYFPYAFKEANICITLKKYFSSVCCSCSNFERISSELVTVFLIALTYLLSHIL